MDDFIDFEIIRFNKKFCFVDFFITKSKVNSEDFLIYLARVLIHDSEFYLACLLYYKNKRAGFLLAFQK